MARDRAKTTKKKTTSVESIRHKDKRANIPTEELRDFVADDEKSPKSMLYPRDPSLDPQLVWKGKDEQDRKDLAVPVVPVYIQEKIHPQAIIDDIRRHASPSPAQAEGDREGSLKGRGEGGGFGEQFNLFADFNGLPEAFDQRVDFYHHEGNWSNRMILGDSLLVMTSLAEKEGLKGKVQTIYFDPPYGIKFGSNWQVSTRKRDVRDGKAEDLTRQPEQIRAFRDCWRIGVHSYLAYIRDILTAARELLTETGSLFVQIGDENVHLVRGVLDEVFGSENFCSQIAFRTTGGQAARRLASVCDLLLWYAKDQGQTKYRQLYVGKVNEGQVGRYQWAESVDGTTPRELSDAELENPHLLPRGWRLLVHDNITSQGLSGESSSPFQWNGRIYNLPTNSHWKTTPDGMKKLAAANRLMAIGATLRFKRFLDDFAVSPTDSVWEDTAISGFGRKKQYVVETNAKVAGRCVLMTTDPGDLVLDPTCGSGTTAYVAEQWGRRWITIDTSRVALALARTRLMAAKYPFYLLADSPEGRRLSPGPTGGVPGASGEAGGTPAEAGGRSTEVARRPTEANGPSVGGSGPTVEASGRSAEASGWPTEAGGRSAEASRRPAEAPGGSGDIRKGFVYKRVPHVTLKSIANNPDIKEGMTREQIDAAIARHAETETLYDQPYEDNKRIRVTGPFTVESLSPHRVLAAADDNFDGAVSETEARKHQDFATMIIDNLRKAGVQNTRKNERLSFDRLDSFAGAWIHAVGEYTDSDGKTRRAAVSIGPEHGTVGPQQVKEAAKEAVQGVGFDVLIVCGFAFDPHVSEETKRYGKLTVLAARMNPDLAMGDELLKKTGAGNLFMVFGEPDVDIRRISEPRPSGSGKQKPPADARRSEQIVVEIKGVDVYDPTTGAIRSSSTDDIACWFIDTDYNGESFFVRHAYFTGAARDGDGPYDKLKRALRAEIDEAAWSSLYSTVSRPFDQPSTGKIAVKVINHYGDEVLKVFEA